MVRTVEERAPVGVLHGAPSVHHEHVVGDLGDQSQVMRDEDDRRSVLGLQAPHEIHDLGLHRDIERSRGLVGDQQHRVERERHRDHGTLPHAAGELMRVVVDPALGPRDPHDAKQLHRLGVSHLARHGPCTRTISEICQPTR